jgi:hypothetical protein
VRGIAERLPFKGDSFDGAFAMNVLHHIPDLRLASSELRRVLKPGCRTVFCEPGLDHLEHPETKRAVREHGENDRPFDALAFLSLSRDEGFADVMLAATVQAPLTLLPLDEVSLYLTGAHPRPWLTPAGVIDEIQRHHAYGMLVNAGSRPKTTRHPGRLDARITVHGLPGSSYPGALVSCVVEAVNTGDTTWLAARSRFGGFVTIGCKLLRSNGTLLTDALGRTLLDRDVAPGESILATVALPLPDTLAAGNYAVEFDLVNELVCWFVDVAPHVPIRYPLLVRAHS